MNCWTKSLLHSLCFASITLHASAKDSELMIDSFLDAIKQGKSVSQFRPRYEYVDREVRPEVANAVTLQTLLGWQTAPFHDISVTAQLINITHLTDDFYDNNLGKNLPSRFPTVQDPEITDINQLYIDYTGLPDTKIRLGRQIVRLDNTRYFGDIIFRQSSQVFNGVMLTNESIKNTEIKLARFERLRQATGKYRDTEIDIAHIAYRYQPKAQAIAYGYFIDQPVTGQNTGAANNSHKDLGVRFDGSIDINSDWRWIHTLEYAEQTAYQSGSPVIDVHYRRVGLGAGYQKWSVRVDEELLSSNDGLYAFQTPFATLHPFQGWTDLFTTTPRQGMKDQFITVDGAWEKWTFHTEWHRLSADERFQTPTGTGTHYGNEWDFSTAYQWNKQIQTKFEYAKFSESDMLGTSPTTASRKGDTTITWLTLLYEF